MRFAAPGPKTDQKGETRQGRRGLSVAAETRRSHVLAQPEYNPPATSANVTHNLGEKEDRETRQHEACNAFYSDVCSRVQQQIDMARLLTQPVHSVIP
jgi:hypothetical protein